VKIKVNSNNIWADYNCFICILSNIFIATISAKTAPLRKKGAVFYKLVPVM